MTFVLSQENFDALTTPLKTWRLTQGARSFSSDPNFSLNSTFVQTGKTWKKTAKMADHIC